jgi:ElaB/YqjD/DUF883 family membrane-anchored ribosome-binding protein
MNSDFYSQAADWVATTARRKPEALLLLAAGCALLMRGGGRAAASSAPRDTSGPPDAYGRRSWQDEAAGEARAGVGRTVEDVSRFAGEVRDRLGDTASAYASTVADYAQDARRRMGEYAGAARENLSSAGEQVARTTQSAARTAGDILREQPLLIAALGLAAGAAVAALFPTSEVERRTLGPAGEALVGAAGAARRDLMERAARTSEEVRRSAEERGLSPEGLRDLAHEAAETFMRAPSSGAADAPRSGTGT